MNANWSEIRFNNIRVRDNQLKENNLWLFFVVLIRNKNRAREGKKEKRNEKMNSKLHKYYYRYNDILFMYLHFKFWNSRDSQQWCLYVYYVLAELLWTFFRLEKRKVNSILFSWKLSFVFLSLCLWNMNTEQQFHSPLNNSPIFFEFMVYIILFCEAKTNNRIVYYYFTVECMCIRKHY